MSLQNDSIVTVQITLICEVNIYSNEKGCTQQNFCGGPNVKFEVMPWTIGAEFETYMFLSQYRITVTKVKTYKDKKTIRRYMQLAYIYMYN